MANVYHLVSVPQFNIVPLVKYTRNVAAHARLHVTKHLRRAMISVLRVVSVLRVLFFMMADAYHSLNVLCVLLVKCTWSAVAHVPEHVINEFRGACSSVVRDISVLRVQFFMKINVYLPAIVPRVLMVKSTCFVVAHAHKHVTKDLLGVLLCVSRDASVPRERSTMVMIVYHPQTALMFNPLISQN